MFLSQIQSGKITDTKGGNVSLVKNAVNSYKTHTWNWKCKTSDSEINRALYLWISTQIKGKL